MGAGEAQEKCTLSLLRARSNLLEAWGSYGQSLKTPAIRYLCKAKITYYVREYRHYLLMIYLNGIQLSKTQTTNAARPRESLTKGHRCKVKSNTGAGEDVMFYSNQRSRDQKNRTFDSDYISPENVE